MRSMDTQSENRRNYDIMTGASHVLTNKNTYREINSTAWVEGILFLTSTTMDVGQNGKFEKNAKVSWDWVTKDFCRRTLFSLSLWIF